MRSGDRLAPAVLQSSEIGWKGRWLVPRVRSASAQRNLRIRSRPEPSISDGRPFSAEWRGAASQFLRACRALAMNPRELCLPLNHVRSFVRMIPARGPPLACPGQTEPTGPGQAGAARQHSRPRGCGRCMRRARMLVYPGFRMSRGFGRIKAFFFRPLCENGGLQPRASAGEYGQRSSEFRSRTIMK
jgi:hypothetical protein